MFNASQRNQREMAFAFFAAALLIPMACALLPPFFTTQSWMTSKVKTTTSFTVTSATTPLIAKTITPSSEEQVSRQKIPFFLQPKNNEKKKMNDDRIPFHIERIEQRNRDQTFKEVSEMCVDVFFNEGTITKIDERNDCDDANGETKKNKEEKVSLWKSMHLNSLRSTQYSDLRSRTFMKTAPGDMFVARRVISATSPPGKSTTIISDVSSVVNSDKLTGTPINGDDAPTYVLGEVLGFVEVFLRPFALGQEDDLTKTGRQKLRPLLTNLSVKKEARKSGVGSKLVQACESAVLSWKLNCHELLLQVEDDNERAIEFYNKRGFQTVFSDPASRRFDTNGFLLKQIRCTKVCMRKCLAARRMQQEAGEGDFDSFKMPNLLQSFKEAVTNR